MRADSDARARAAGVPRWQARDHSAPPPSLFRWVFHENIAANIAQDGAFGESLSGAFGHIERGTRVPSLEMLTRLGTGLGVASPALLVDPDSTSKDSLNQRLQAVIDALSKEEKLDLLAILGQRHAGKELKALRVLLRV